MYKSFNINNKIIDFVNNCESELVNDFKQVNAIYEHNQLKVLKSFIDCKISESCFQESTGYGYNDIGRDKIEELYSKVFNTEDALVRQQIVSGTHAIALALFSLLKPNDSFLSITGIPYDTLHHTIGFKNEPGSLAELNIKFDCVDLINNKFDYECIKNKINANTKLIMIQRSRGYSSRKPISINDIKEVCKFIKSIDNSINILVDNCYGEFVNELEPTDVGCDIMCGSLIKNPGGSLAKSGGYIVGKKELIELCSYRLTAPGIGKEVGTNFNQNRNVLQGLYLAPQIVKNSLLISKLYSYVLNKLNYQTVPKYGDEISDIVISIFTKDKDELFKICKVIQETSPVDSFVKPESNYMPGYDNQVIMAAGCFVSGASIELSCDAPIREPYIAFLQGGINYFQGKLALMKIISELDLLK